MLKFLRAWGDHVPGEVIAVQEEAVMLKFLRAWAVVLALLLAGPALGAPVKTEAEAAKLAGQAVLRYHLTSLREECFVLDVDELKTYIDVGGTGATQRRVWR